MKLVCLFLFGFFCSVLSFSFEESGDGDAKFDTHTTTAQIINITESNSGERVHIALITDVTDTLTINVLDSDLAKALNVQLIDGPLTETKYLTANRLDYESLADGENSLTMFVMDTEMNEKTLVLNILNIDDENPSLTVSTCSMNENETLTVSTGCEFTVSDPDGFLDKMDFTNILDDTDLFEFKYKDEPKDGDKEAKVYLVLKKGKLLDFETSMVYNVQVLAKDSANHPTVPAGNVPIRVNVVDKPDETPIWASFKEFYNVAVNTSVTIQVKAIDGDFGINNPINYKIVESSVKDITIDEESGLVTIAPIYKSTEVNFTVQAYEKPEPTSFTEGTITVIVHDTENNESDLSFHHTYRKKVVVIEEEYTSDLENIHIPLIEDEVEI